MPVEVAAAVIERADGSFLLARRPAGKVYAGWWEFPGGKIHTGESAREAIARELAEELGIEVRCAYPWITREHVYEHAHVRINFFRVTEWSGEPHPHENQAFAWQRLDAPMAEPMLPANAPVLAALALPLEYAITDAARMGVQASLEALERRLREGLRLVQVRDRELADREAFARRVVETAHRHGARVLVGGGPAIGDGMHYSAAELMRAAARPQGGLAGASCHTREELERAMALGMDFAVLGPVKETATHPGATPLGWERFAAIARGASIPVYAIGGLRCADLHEARMAGAHGIAMIRGAWER
ncbi:MAG: Nudix family hydrolase [Pseudomonadota bacterium]